MRNTLPGRRAALAGAIAAAAGGGLLAAPAALRAQGGGGAAAPRVRMALDWAFQAPNAFALVARDRGFFREAGVEVQVDRGSGSGRVPVSLASGAYEIGYADINPAIRFAAENPGRGLLCVAVLHDRSPLCAIVRADGPVRAPKDLEGRTLAAPDFDAGRQLFPAFAKAAGLDAAKVNWQTVAPELREPMLVQRRADGVTGFVTTSALALKGLGLGHEQQRVLMYYDHGLELYGGALLTTQAFAQANPQALRGCVAALIRGLRWQIANPAEAMQILRRADGLTDVPLETERHQMNLERCIATPHAHANGLSAVDPGRMQRGIRAVEESYGLPARLQAGEFYTPEFLPPRAELAL